jgi:alpha-mannosidase
MDQGIQTFRMLLVPHSDNWRKSSIPRLAEEFITPCSVIYQGIHGGRMAASGSFLSAGPGNIVVSTVKLSENGDDLILRCLETSGVQTFVSLRLDFAGTSWSGDFHPFEIKTLRFNRNTEGIKVVTLLEE